MPSPIPNLLFAWDREDPSLEILDRVLSHCLARLSFRPRPPPDCGNRASSRPAAPTSRRPRRPLPASGHRAAVPEQHPQPVSPQRRAYPQRHSPPARPPAHSRGRQRRRLHCGSSRASERRHRPPPPAPAPFQPRTPALPARRAAFHPPQRGRRARLTARHHLRRRTPRPWPARPGALRLPARLPRSPECGRWRRWRDGRARGLGHFRVRPRPRRRRDGTAMRPPAAAEDPSLGASPSSCSCCCCC